MSMVANFYWCFFGQVRLTKAYEKSFANTFPPTIWWRDPPSEFGEEINKQDASQQIKGFLGE